nr:uncharacterized protein LOC125418933 [Ziziphus jujuba var. spinosa]
MAYRIDLSEELSRVHDVFHISMLHKYISDPSHVLETPEIELRDDLSFEEQPVQNLGREEKRLRNKTIALAKVLWRNHLVEEATWEQEDQMLSQYPYPFQN